MADCFLFIILFLPAATGTFYDVEFV